MSTQSPVADWVSRTPGSAPVPGAPSWSPGLAQVWRDVLFGRLRVEQERVEPARVLLFARVTRQAPSVCESDAALLTRILRGDPQKEIAWELRVAASTLSGRYVHALASFGLSPRHLPLPLVLAAQSAADLGPITAVRTRILDRPGGASLVVSVPRTAASRMTGLTPAERAVAQGIIEGHSRSEIARRRGTSVHTVGRQFHSIFEAMNATGRFALIRRAVERGAFGEPEGRQTWTLECIT